MDREMEGGRGWVVRLRHSFSLGWAVEKAKKDIKTEREKTRGREVEYLFPFLFFFSFSQQVLLLFMLRLRPLVVGVWLLQQDNKAKGATGCTLLVRADHHDETN